MPEKGNIMAKSRDYIVSFSPAERQPWGGYTVALSLMTGGVKHTVTADSFAVLETEVRRLAREFGRTCSPYVRLPRGERNPPGFDAWCRTVNIIDVEAAGESV